MSSRRSVSGPQTRVVWRSVMVLALAAIAALAFSGAFDSMQTGLLTTLPAIALAVMMLTRPYLGERVIARLRAVRRRRRSDARQARVLPRPAATVARGGRLIALALAGRAPPLGLAGCR